MTLVVGEQRLTHAAPRGCLKLRINRGCDCEAAQTCLFRLKAVKDAFGDLDGFRSQRARWIGGRCEGDRLFSRALPLRFAEEALFAHLVQDVAPTSNRRGHVGSRMKVARVGDSPRDERCLGNREFACALAEIVACGLLDSIAAATKENIV